MYLEVKDLKKSYGEGGGYVQVLKGINAGVEQGEMCVIQGTSGSGKSTLLNCIGGLDTVDSGSIVVDGQEVAGLNSKALSNYRREKLGFIFQSFHLIPSLNVLDNVLLPMLYRRGSSASANRKRALELIEKVGLTHRLKHFPSQLSGGQCQRVAIARALIGQPKVILADEPTGNLDVHNSMEIMELLEEINRRGTTVLVVTHSREIVAEMGKRVITLTRGVLTGDQKGGIWHEN